MPGLAHRIHKALHPVRQAPGVVHTPAQRWLLGLGSCAYVGYLPASGALSVALVGIPVHALLLAPLAPWVYVVVVLSFTLLSVWVHDRGDKILGEKDSGKLVLDELAGYFIAMSFLGPLSWQLILIGYLLERVLDVLKVPPADWLEDHAPGGWGVVLDDVMAGLYACGILHVLRLTVPAVLGLPAG